LDSFYETYLAPLETRMLRTAWRIAGDPDRARDALQDAMARVWAQRDRVCAHPNPGALVLRITTGSEARPRGVSSSGRPRSSPRRSLSSPRAP
jgi:hypothetical protein